MRRWMSLAVAGLLASGCPMLALVRVDHAGDGLRSPHRIGPPQGDRCAALAARRSECEREREAATLFVRRLMVDDQVCLEGNPLRDGVTRRCRVRAFVEDVSSESVKLEIREAPPGSSFEPMSDYWYHEAALVELQLEAAGYTFPR